MFLKPTFALIMLAFDVLCFFEPICNDKFDFTEEWRRTHNEPNFEQCEIKATLAGPNYADNSNKIWLAFTPEQLQELLNSYIIYATALYLERISIFSTFPSDSRRS
jgi:hypothetical protein